MISGSIVSINVSRGGVPKRPVAAARVTTLGLEGDGHNDSTHHGGPERAVCLYSAERIEALVAEGHAIAPGAIGENVTVRGIDWQEVAPGDYYYLGDRVIIQVTGYANPCATIQGSFRDRRYPRVSQKHHPGWSRVYARVLATGEIRVGDRVGSLTPDEAQASVEPDARAGPAEG